MLWMCSSKNLTNVHMNLWISDTNPPIARQLDPYKRWIKCLCAPLYAFHCTDNDFALPATQPALIAWVGTFAFYLGSWLALPHLAPSSKKMNKKKHRRYLVFNLRLIFLGARQWLGTCLARSTFWNLDHECLLYQGAPSFSFALGLGKLNNSNFQRYSHKWRITPNGQNWKGFP